MIGGALTSSDVLIAQILAESAAAITRSHELVDEIVAAADRIGEAFDAGHKLLLCGNGGSAADAQHFAGELMGRFLSSAAHRAPRPAVALSADSAVLTCIGNDYGFEDVFARQVVGLAQPGDVLVGISTSGTSPNVLRAFQVAGPLIVKIALCGPGGQLAALADLALCVPAESTAAIQAAHISIIHALCSVLEVRFADGERTRTPATPGTE